MPGQRRIAGKAQNGSSVRRHAHEPVRPDRGSPSPARPRRDTDLDARHRQDKFHRLPRRSRAPPRSPPGSPIELETATRDDRHELAREVRREHLERGDPQRARPGPRRAPRSTESSRLREHPRRAARVHRDHTPRAPLGAKAALQFFDSLMRNAQAWTPHAETARLDHDAEMTWSLRLHQRACGGSLVGFMWRLSSELTVSAAPLPPPSHAT